MDFFNKLSEKQKIYVYLAVFFISAFILLKSFVYPVFEKNDKLSKQLLHQQELNQYLLDSQKILVNNKIFPKLNSKSAKQVIDKSFQNIAKNTFFKDKNVVFKAKNQNFSKIIQIIDYLKENNGIVVIKANIQGVKKGLVNAEITFDFPR
jgi:type II secretory pathway component PulM